MVLHQAVGFEEDGGHLSNLLDVWTLKELRKSDLKGSELTNTTNKVPDEQLAFAGRIILM